ncbi:aspartate/glutamate racemase family protein [Candidatus Poriferisodalis sp.]|uniref:aspartate/glutamate racemase family protein n=1 Tax=Candidatus Poriferisodalis sp. TaxID=3101277 RepID=UPI003C6FF996
MNIHIIVPITSDSFNELIAQEARSFLGPDIEIEVSCLTSGPASIESFYDEALAGPGIVSETMRAAAAGADAVFITCFGDPAVPAARELVDIPVVGGFEPAVATALNLGERFSVVTVLENVVPMISGLATRMGIRDRMASVEVIDTPVLELHDGDALLDSLTAASHSALDRGADVLVLGCTGMLDVAAALQSRLESERVRVPVVDPTGASLGLLLTLQSMGLKPSRRTYMPPPDKARTGAAGA